MHLQHQRWPSPGVAEKRLISNNKPSNSAGWEQEYADRNKESKVTTNEPVKTADALENVKQIAILEMANTSASTKDIIGRYATGRLLGLRESTQMSNVRTVIENAARERIRTAQQSLLRTQSANMLTLNANAAKSSMAVDFIHEQLAFCNELLAAIKGPAEEDEGLLNSIGALQAKGLTLTTDAAAVLAANRPYIEQVKKELEEKTKQKEDKELISLVDSTASLLDNFLKEHHPDANVDQLLAAYVLREEGPLRRACEIAAASKYPNNAGAQEKLVDMLLKQAAGMVQSQTKWSMAKRFLKSVAKSGAVVAGITAASALVFLSGGIGTVAIASAIGGAVGGVGVTGGRMLANKDVKERVTGEREGNIVASYLANRSRLRALESEKKLLEKGSMAERMQVLKELPVESAIRIRFLNGGVAPVRITRKRGDKIYLRGHNSEYSISTTEVDSMHWFMEKNGPDGTGAPPPEPFAYYNLKTEPDVPFTIVPNNP